MFEFRTVLHVSAHSKSMKSALKKSDEKQRKVAWRNRRNDIKLHFTTHYSWNYTNNNGKIYKIKQTKNGDSANEANQSFGQAARTQQ